MDSYVTDKYDNSYKLSKCLGQGGQGAVYLLSRDFGKGLALKVKLDSAGTEILKDEKEYKKYTKKITHIAALPDLPNVAVPLVMLKSPFCGYIMRLMEGMEPLSNYMDPEKDEEGQSRNPFEWRGGLKKRMELLLNLALVLRNIHGNGIVYGDLSPENVFVSVDDTQRQVWLIDPDNMAYEYEARKNSVGTPNYRAPEVARGEGCSIATDCYSFALLAYECLTMSGRGGAFQGTLANSEEESWDDFGESIDVKIECGDFPYVHEPGSKNEPMFGASKDLSQVMTPELEALFLQTLGPQGRKNPISRPSMDQWASALERACDMLCFCSNGHWHFGEKCFICGAKSVSERYTLTAYYSFVPVGFDELEDGAEMSIAPHREKLYEKKWAWPMMPDVVPTPCVRVPWQVFCLPGKEETQEAALEISFSRGQLKITPCSEILRLDDKLLDSEQKFTVCTRDRKIEFEITKG